MCIELRGGKVLETHNREVKRNGDTMMGIAARCQTKVLML